MKLKSYILTIFLILSVSAIGWAKGVGTTMFPILQLPTSAYDGALAYTTVAGEYSAIQNPAIIPFLKRSVILSHAVYLEDTRYSVGDVNLMLNEKSGVNFSFCYFDYGKIDRYIESGSGYEKKGSFNPDEKVLNISYGRSINRNLYAGASIKYISQSIDDVSYSGYAIGFSGLYFITDNMFLSSGINNLGPQVSGYDMPTNFYFGFSGEVDEEKGVLAVAQLDAYYNDEVYEFKVAIEKQYDDTFFLRAGYVVPLENHNGTNNSFITNLTLGAGLKYKGFFVDYAWLPKGDLGNVHMFSLRADF